MLLIVILYGIIGNPITQVRQETEIFNKIEAKHIEIKNDNGDVVARIGVNNEGDELIGLFNKYGTPLAVIGTSDVVGFIWLADEKGENPEIYTFKTN